MKINKSVFDSFPVLKTRRLTLRDIQTKDAQQIFEMRANGRVNQFIARDQMNKKEFAIELTSKAIDAFKNGLGIGWAGVLRNGEEIIGTCGFNQIDYQNCRAEIGGELSTVYWGKGIPIEALEAIVEFGFNNMNLHTIEAKVSPDNRGAIFALTSLGFEKEAHYKDRFFFNNTFSDMAVYTIINKFHASQV